MHEAWMISSVSQLKLALRGHQKSCTLSHDFGVLGSIPVGVSELKVVRAREGLVFHVWLQPCAEHQRHTGPYNVEFTVADRDRTCDLR